MGYLSLYLPLLSTVYLRNNEATGIELFGQSVPPISGDFYFLTLGVLFFGALIEHGIYKSIHGSDGPQSRPKSTWTVRYQRYALLFFKRPGMRPKSVDEAENRLSEWLESVSSSPIRLVLVSIRAVVLSLIETLFRITSIIVTILLLTHVTSGKIDYLGFSLLLSQSVFLFAPFIWNRFPTPVPEEAAEWIFVPEYQRTSNIDTDLAADLQYDPRGFWEDMKNEYERMERQVERESRDVLDKDAEYLIELPESNTDYVITLDENDE